MAVAIHKLGLVGVALQLGVALVAGAQQVLALAPAPGTDGLRPAGWTPVALRAVPAAEPAVPMPTFALPSRVPAPEPARAGAVIGVFGDYVFARPALGNLRATSGLLSAQAGGLPVAAPAAAEADLGQAYIGLGIDSTPLWPGLRLSADLGVAASRPGAGAYGARIGPGAPARDLRLAPRLQFGLRYAF